MRIAYFSPLNPAPSGIADYSEELLPYLAKYGEITPVVDGYAPTNPEITDKFRVVDDRAYRAADYDLALYQLGNSPAHAYIYKRALEEPGVLVLHEVVLHHLIAWLTLNQGDTAGYVAAMREAYGAEGARLGEREALGLEALNRFEYPLSETVVRAARGVIVHSVYAAEKVQALAPQVPVVVIPHELPLVDVMGQAEARAALGLAADARYVGSFGNLGPTKRTTVLLEAFRSVRETYPNARLLLVGAVSPNFDAEGLMELFGLQDAVELVGYVPFGEFQQYMAAMDVCVNLRYPTAGETSGAVLRMMAQAKPVIVSDVGWFGELPDDAVAKVAVDDYEVGLLTATLLRLSEDARLRAALGANARRYVVETCDVAAAARQYADFLNAVREGKARTRIPAIRARGESAAVAQTADSVGAQAGPIPPPQARSTDWRDELAQALVTLSCGEDEAVLRQVARATVELGLAE